MCDMSLFLQCVETALRRVAVSLRVCGTGLQCAGKVLCYSAEELTAMRRGGGVVVSVRN